jgi:hypothetical protein
MGLAAGISEAVGHPVKSLKDVERLPVGSKVALARATCKTVWNTEVDKKKAFLFWFEPKTKHECPWLRRVYDGVYHWEPRARALW